MTGTAGALFVGDMFRTHTMLKGGRYGGSTRKLATLLRNTVECLGYRCRVIEDRDSDGLAALYTVFFGDYDNVHTWAQRSQVLSPRVAEFYDRLLDGVRLVIGFEVPESLYDHCCRAGIAVFDFSFHFVRFEADYSVMVRTNRPRAQALLRRIRHHVCHLDIQAKLAGDTADTVFDEMDEIRLFLIQTRFDRSKFDGKGGVLDDLERIRAAALPVTHYKLHPMEHRPEIELQFSYSGAEPFPTDVNIYGFLARYGHKTRLYTISSGLAAEGDLIGVKSVDYLVGFPWTIEGYETYSAPPPQGRDRGLFIAVDNRVFAPDFARALFAEDDWQPAPGAARSQFSLKEFWNVKWS